MWHGYRLWKNQWHMGIKLMNMFLATCFHNPTQWAKFKITVSGVTDIDLQEYIDGTLRGRYGKWVD